ncbi:polyhydroxyalkanoic acid system family protein [Piscinibacter koreensis]|uniref:Polyhydroxyalkanoic acid system family protein n=1 Tax=Piscinibacter koreensis TaxID=2742824 RepID=A0A7Y6TX22_9BURK|nr:polyhydroxyalkanoic acid system family protein [Schlegelella koreensis]NUZ06647.1 polyhydroxyalkanoic acid system family protein [Schlegelella koreensis]
MIIRFRRQHALGLVEMRRLVRPWIRDLAARYALQTFVVKGRNADVVKFSRAGVDGEVSVGADHVEVSAQFGFLFAAFGQTIGAEIEKNLDAFMADARRASAEATAAGAPSGSDAPGAGPAAEAGADHLDGAAAAPGARTPPRADAGPGRTAAKRAGKASDPSAAPRPAPGGAAAVDRAAAKRRSRKA